MADLDSLGTSSGYSPPSGYSPALDGQTGDSETAGSAARFQDALDEARLSRAGGDDGPAAAPASAPIVLAQAGGETSQPARSASPVPAPAGAVPVAAANANAGMSTSAAGTAALRVSEGQRNGGGYYDDAANNCTRGTGILVHPGPCTPAEAARPVDQQANEAEFQRRLHNAENAVRQRVPDRQLTQEQFDSLVSATFNLGATGARLILDRANHNDDPGVARELRAQIHIQPRDAQRNPVGPLVVSRGLINRREREATPFDH